MEYLRNYNSVDEVIGTTSPTPYVGIVHSSSNVIMASKDKYGDEVSFVDDGEGGFKPKKPTPTIKLSANGEGQIIVNKGLASLQFTVDLGITYTFVRNSSSDKIVSDVQYYAYTMTEGTMYITKDLSTKSVGDTVNGTIYQYNEESGTMQDAIGQAVTMTVTNVPDGTIVEQTLSYTSGNNQEIEVEGSVLSVSTTANSTLTAIELPNTITQIDDYAFRSCTSLASVTYSNVKYTNASTLIDDLRNNSITVGASVFDGTQLEGDSVEYIDLGITNSEGKKVLWANMNIGAKTESDYGAYYQWGDTVGYYDASHSTWSTAPFNDGNESYSSTYWASVSASTVTKDANGDYNLNAEYDAATVAYGSGYRMPTYSEYELLKANTTSEWTTVNGINGRRFTSKVDTSKSIFIPAAGSAYEGSVFNVGYYCNSWSSSLFTFNPYYAWKLYFDSDYMGMNNDGRYYGCSARGVLVQD